MVLYDRDWHSYICLNYKTGLGAKILCQVSKRSVHLEMHTACGLWERGLKETDTKAFDSIWKL